MRAFEHYVLTDRKLDEALKMLVEGSDAYNYLKLLHHLVEKGQLSSDERKQLDDFLKRSPYSSASELELRARFLAYDAAHTPEEKSAVLDGLVKDYMGVTFTDQRPQDLTAGTAMQDVSSPAETDNVPLDRVDMAEELRKLYRKDAEHMERNVSEFHPAALLGVDLSQFSGSAADAEALITSLHDYVALCDPKELAKLLAGIAKERATVQGYYTWDRNMLGRLTLQQLERLRELCPEHTGDIQFIGALFRKRFHQELVHAEDGLPLKERRADLLRMYEFACGFPADKVSGLKGSLLLEILDNGVKQELFEEKYFNEYIKSPLRMAYCKQNAQTEGEEWAGYLQEVRSKEYKSGHAAANKRDRELFAAYLDKMFLAGRSVANYADFFNKEFLVAIWEESQMMAGRKVEVSSGNAKRLETIKDKVLIDICPHNKDSFTFGEEIALFVDVKNVPSLIVKVFDINAENYYMTSMSAFKSDINLDGFVATIERTVNYAQAQSVKHRETLKFPELQGKFGLYVIEMIGNGKSSRAVVKVGTLSYVARSTVAGQICYVLDSDRKVCVGERTGIRLQNQFFPAESRDKEHPGRIVIPYALDQTEEKAILVHEGIAQLVDFERQREDYAFSCGFFLHPDSVVMGSKATLLLRPLLTVNGRAAPLSLLENPRVTVRATNFIDGIPVTKVYDNFKVETERDLELPFNIISHMQSLSVEFVAEVKCVATNKKQPLSASHEFQMRTHESDNVTEELHFRCVNPGPIYEVLLLGKNGEPVPNTAITVEFALYLINTPITRTFMTNAAGTIRLGKLAGVVSIIANVNRGEGAVSRSWNVPANAYFAYPDNVDLIEDEAIEFPFTEFGMKPRLTSTASDWSTVVADCSPELRVAKKESDAAYGMVRVEGLAEGNYVLRGLGPDSEGLKITVHKGSLWDGKEDFILTSDALLEVPMRKDFVRVKSVKIAEKDAANSQVTVQIESRSPTDCRVHMILYNFLSESMDTLTDDLCQNEQYTSGEFPFQKWKNFYLSNRLLSSELQYCIERRQQGKLTGSTVEKPSLVLKGALIGPTRSEAEAVTAGTAFEALSEETTQIRHKMKPSQRKGRISRKECECEDAEEEYDQKQVASRAPQAAKLHANSIEEYQNFLAPSSVFWNARVDANGTVVVTVAKSLLAQASGVYVVAVGPAGVAHYIYPLVGTEKLCKRDLALQKPFDPEKSYSEVRLAVGVQKSESHVIEDITSTHFLIVDSLDLVYGILEKLAEMDGHSCDAMKEFGFVTYWNTFTEEQKLQSFVRYMSHELNLFIMKKDPAFFKKVVRPYLANKMEKDLVDLYLLELPLEEYYDEPHKFALLNSLEKALLVHYLARTGKKEKAIQFATLMRSQLADKDPDSADHDNKVFDTALMQSALKDRKSELEKMAEEGAFKGNVRFEISARRQPARAVCNRRS